MGFFGAIFFFGGAAMRWMDRGENSKQKSNYAKSDVYEFMHIFK